MPSPVLTGDPLNHTDKLRTGYLYRMLRHTGQYSLQSHRGSLKTLSAIRREKCFERLRQRPSRGRSGGCSYYYCYYCCYGGACGCGGSCCCCCCCDGGSICTCLEPATSCSRADCHVRDICVGALQTDTFRRRLYEPGIAQESPGRKSFESFSYSASSARYQYRRKAHQPIQMVC